MAAPRPAEVAAAYATVQRAADRDILRILRDAYKEVNAALGRAVRDESASAPLARARLLAIKQNILRQQSELYGRIGKVVEQRRTEAAARAIQVSGRYDELVFEAVGRGEIAEAVTRGLEETELRTIDAAVARLNGSSVPLSSRVYKTQAYASGLLERRVNSALARGLNAREFAREIRDFVNPNTPGGQRYAALRLARTEINNAYHAMAIQAAMRKPWVTKVKWNLSKSHPRPDECNALDGRLFAPEDCPRKPHPICLCYITQEIPDTQADEDAFLDALVGGEFDDFLVEFADLHSLPQDAPAPATAALPTNLDEFELPRIGDVPEHPESVRLTDDPVLRHELNLQAAITPTAMTQLFRLELTEDLPAGTGGTHNRALHAIRIASNIWDGMVGRSIYDKAERANFHPRCGRDHNSAQLHLAHEYGHHVHHMLEFMPVADREALRDLIADAIGAPRPERAGPDSQDTIDLKAWMETNRRAIGRAFGEYAQTNEREMMAEIWSAYSTNPDTTEVIRKIGARMRRLGEAGAQRGQISRPDQDIDALAEKIKKARELGLL